jgi:Ca2+-binding EF-hand superfamily protein
MKHAIALLPLLLPLASCSHSNSHTITERKMIGLLEKFDRWDEDGNGRLNHAELTHGLAGTDHQPANVLKFYDTNRDGSISLREAQAGYARANEADAIIRKRKETNE